MGALVVVTNRNLLACLAAVAWEGFPAQAMRQLARTCSDVDLRALAWTMITLMNRTNGMDAGHACQTNT